MDTRDGLTSHRSAAIGRRGAFSIETTVLIVVIASAMIFIAPYLQRAKQGQVFDLSRSSGEQFDVRDPYQEAQRLESQVENIDQTAMTAMDQAPFMETEAQLTFGTTKNLMGLVSLPTGAVPREPGFLQTTSARSAWRNSEESHLTDQR